MMIVSRQGQEHSPKYVHFANGFPPKELIPAQQLSSGVNMHGGVFVGLHEEATSKLTRSQRTIPPLAKGRANYFPVKHRVSSSRYRDVANPFDTHKGTEKTGFTPQAIKRSKPKLEKTSGRNEHNMTHTQSNQSVNNPNISLKLSRQTMCPVSTLLNGNESIPRSPSEANSRILYDVEKDVIQNELLGIDEVYKKVCNGSMDSLCSLISPVKGKQRLRQASSMHFIQTSTPLSLNTKTLKAPQWSSKEEGSEASPEKDGKESENYDQGLKNKLTKQSPHTILVPLPYFTAPSRPPHTAPARFKESHNRPRIYGTRTSYLPRTGALSSLSGWSSPSVINFNASDLPQISRPVTRACGPTGSIIGVQNKSHTGKVAIVASVEAVATPPATPPATAASEFYKHQFDINNHGPATTNGKDYSPEVDSISSEDIEYNIVNNNDFKKDEQETKQTGVTRDDGKMIERELGEECVEDVPNKISGMNVAVTLNVIDETGSVNDVEIFNPEERDLQKQEQVTRDIQEAQNNYQKRKQEIETLLDEHGNLVHQVNNLSKELQD